MFCYLATELSFSQGVCTDSLPFFANHLLLRKSCVTKETSKGATPTNFAFHILKNTCHRPKIGKLPLWQVYSVQFVITLYKQLLIVSGLQTLGGILAVSVRELGQGSFIVGVMKKGMIQCLEILRFAIPHISGTCALFTCLDSD